MANPDAIYVNFPDYIVDTGIADSKVAQAIGLSAKNGKITAPLGHGAVIAVDEQTGKTRGSEYGRYDAENKGEAHKVKIPDFKMATPGSPTQEELDNYAKKLDKSYGHSGGATEVYYIPDADEDKMIEMMESAEKDKDNGFYRNKDYNILTHNCGTYAADMIKKALPGLQTGGFQLVTHGTPSYVAPSSKLVGKYKQK